MNSQQRKKKRHFHADDNKSKLLASVYSDITASPISRDNCSLRLSSVKNLELREYLHACVVKKMPPSTYVCTSP